GRVVEIYGPEASGKTTLALHVISEAQKQGVGKLPASQANPEVVSAFRREEKEQVMRLLDNYLRICRAAKVKASFMMTEADQVQKGIVALVVGHNIRRLVIGAMPEGWMKVKRNSRKANYAAKNAPPSVKYGLSIEVNIFGQEKLLKNLVLYHCVKQLKQKALLPPNQLHPAVHCPKILLRVLQILI
ncbi:hypothetical protein S245_022307, partial [Arachis hypogaea]